MKIVADRLKKARELKGVTQTAVSKNLGINSKTLSGYENNVAEPDLETLSLLAKYYECDINYFVGVDSREFKEAEAFIGKLKKEVAKNGYNLSDKSTEEIAALVVNSLKIHEILKDNLSIWICKHKINRIKA